MRWTNPNHPQTLHIGVILLYIDAFFALFGGARGIGPLMTIGAVGSAVGIANDKRIAWYVGIALSALAPVVLARWLWLNGLTNLFDFNVMIDAVFPIAQLVALVHPMSRSYVKSWFE